jgi:glycosyltransferase involved in cell wall biosynthesis
LYIANPGYKSGHAKETHANVIILGSLPHHKMMQHVCESLCIFYPQDSFAETFGLIYAEANAYQTAVLAHDIGSAREILHPNNPLIDANNKQLIVDTIKAWQKHYPKINYNNKFSDTTILSQWQKLLR